MGVTFSEEGTQIDTEISSWTKWGDCNWKIAGCLLLCWTLVCLALIKGVQSYGKVAYFTTLFPYVVLTIFLGYSATLPGFSKGTVDYFAYFLRMSSLKWPYFKLKLFKFPAKIAKFQA